MTSNGWGGFGRFMRPPRQETKEYGVETDVKTPLAQYAVAIVVLFIAVVMIGSWALIIPPEVPWAIGVAIFWIAPLVAVWYVTAWLLMYITESEKAIAFHVFFTIAAAVFWSLAMWNIVWDWWWKVCESWWTFGVPSVHIEGTTAWLWLGIALMVLGAAFSLFRQPTWYILGMQGISAMAIVLSLRLSPVEMQLEYRRPFIFYAMWFALTIAVVVPAAPFLYRMGKEMMDTYMEHYEPTGVAAPVEQFTAKDYIPVITPARSTSLEDPGPITEITGPKGENWQVSETNLIEFIHLLAVRGLSQRRWMSWAPPAGLIMYNQKGRLMCKKGTWTQWGHWAPYYHFLQGVGIHEKGKVDAMFLDADGHPDPEAILAYLKLNGYAEEVTDETTEQVP